MTDVLLAFVTSALVVGLAMGAMALGAIIRSRPLRHGCGESSCAGCRRPCATGSAREEGRWSDP